VADIEERGGSGIPVIEGAGDEHFLGVGVDENKAGLSGLDVAFGVIYRFVCGLWVHSGLQIGLGAVYCFRDDVRGLEIGSKPRPDRNGRRSMRVSSPSIVCIDALLPWWTGLLILVRLNYECPG
jgi:hypothetical protein